MNRLFGAFWLVVAGLLLTQIAVADDNTPIECGATSTYYPLGYVWAPTPPAADNPITLHFYQEAPSNTGAQSLTLADAKAAVIEAFQTWGAVTCNAKSVNLPEFVASATDHPTMDHGDVWENLELTSHKNVVYWDNTGSNPLFSDKTLAYTMVNFGVTAQAIDADMVFDDAAYSWRVDSSASSKGCAAGEENCFDIETVALHEAGHFIGFGHVNCAEAVLFPMGSGASTEHALSNHEEAGACALYPPRETTGNRATGESCEASAECPANHSCLVSESGGNLYGRCVELCTLNSDCGDGYYCGSVPLQGGSSLKYCAPGLRGDSTSTIPTLGDMCSPCSSGTHCQSGLCLEMDGNQFCSQSCNDVSSCPTGFSCMETQGGAGFCWPDNPADCGIDEEQPVLNDLCYSQGAGPGGGDYFEPCGPGLICMGFRPLCQGLKGACVLYCDIGTPCQDGLTCCYGIDASGHCMGPSADATVGGCFDIRSEGQACVTAEQSICREGFECVAYGDATAAKCYEQCPNDVCVGDEYCLTTPPLCDGVPELKNCCSNNNLETCTPGTVSALREVGLACSENADCYSGLCLKYDNTAACSRSCDIVTGIGCPGVDADVNGDGVADGGFDCLMISGEPRCWPKNGVIGQPPPEPTTPTYSAPSGCCRVLGHPLSYGDLFLSAIVWVPFAISWIRSRRRRS